MRKIGLLALAAALTAALAGCSGTASVPAEPTASPAVTAKPFTPADGAKWMDEAMRDAGDVVRGNLNGVTGLMDDTIPGTYDRTVREGYADNPAYNGMD